MAVIKTAAEIKLMRKAGQILAEVRTKVLNFVRPGVTTLELDQIAHQAILARGGKPSFLNYHGFPNVICTSVNEILIHGIPNQIKLKDEDLLSLDFGVSYHGYHADAAITVSVGQTTPENQRLIEISQKAFWIGFNAIKKGVKTGDIGYKINQFVNQKNHLFVPKEFAGHGIGSNLHEDPIIFNYGQLKTGTEICDNMVICIEPMIIQKSHKIKILNDGWSVKAVSHQKTAHYEHTILINNGKPEILTGGK